MKLRNKDTGEDGRLVMCHDDEYPLYIEIESIRIYYHSFAEMIDAGWDCSPKPAEPLIKDEKVRKAVRAWAEALKLVKCRYDAYWKAFRFCDQTISFIGLCDFDLEDERIYYIAELCGEDYDG